MTKKEYIKGCGELAATTAFVAMCREAAKTNASVSEDDYFAACTKGNVLPFYITMFKDKLFHCAKATGLIVRDSGVIRSKRVGNSAELLPLFKCRSSAQPDMARAWQSENSEPFECDL